VSPAQRRRSLQRVIALALPGLLAGSLLATATNAADAASSGPNPLVTPDSSGLLGTFSTSGLPMADPSNAFFASLGSNGRTCATCHAPLDGWSITPQDVQVRFLMSGGTDPLFRLNDGAVSPLADISSLAARQRAYSMLLSKGLIRVGIGIPPGAEFDLAAVDDPYGFASTAELSLFRRPLPSTNLPFLSAVMWDGRETIQPITSASTSPADTLALQTDLAHQALDATLGHAQAVVPPSAAQQQQIVQFELGLFTAQLQSFTAGPLPGPLPLSQQPFHVGVNDPLGSSFIPDAMTLFGGPTWSWSAARQQVVRGQRIFNERPIAITGVAGLNDVLGQPTITGTCTTCHNTPNVGDHSSVLPVNVGVSDPARRTSDLPLYTLRNLQTGQTVQTTDPGRALITGKWADIGKFKGPVLRGLAARAPYFHNGSAASLEDVVSFYNTRFNIGLSPADQADLVAFLRAL
jgi:hypothetical protein